MNLGPDQTSTTKVESSITCQADPLIAFDFQNPNVQGCTCSATLTDEASGAAKKCACAPCPADSIAAVSIDCAQASTTTSLGCTYIGCDGACTGGGVAPSGQIPSKEASTTDEVSTTSGMIPPKEGEQTTVNSGAARALGTTALFVALGSFLLV